MISGSPTNPATVRVMLRLMALVGLALVLFGLSIALGGGGGAFRMGPISVSAKDPARLVMEGSLLALLSLSLVGLKNRKTSATIFAVLLLMYYGALVGGSTSRRVGDGHEYIAMAFQLAHFRMPDLSATDAAEFSTLQHEHSGIAGAVAVGLDANARSARTEFVHFWLYSLVAAPALRVADWLGIGWNTAFCVVNTALLIGLGLLAVSRMPPIYACALLVSPIVWWLDKAHIEVFTYALLGMATVLLRDRPHLALVLLGILSAQNPAFGLVLLPLIACTIYQSNQRVKSIAVSAGALAIAAFHPIYYTMRIGRPFPLANAADWTFPTLTGIASPLLDPLLGILWYLPWPFALTLLTETTPGRSTPALVRVSLVLSTLALLVLFATSGNVNHGATPGPSRYGVWLLPMVFAWFVGAAEPRAWRRSAAIVTVVVSVVHSTWAFHPKLQEDGWHTTPLAVWLLEVLPAAYDPLPEVFAERFGRFDGPAHLPVATPGCRKVLLVGAETHTLWPFPCVPEPLPAWCARSGAICYANRRPRGGYEFSAPPKQPSFVVGHRTDAPTWSSSDEFRTLPVKVEWSELRHIPPTSSESVIREARDVKRIRAYQSPKLLLAFVEPLNEKAPAVRLDARHDCGWWLSSDGRTQDVSFVGAGGSWHAAPSAALLILVAADECSDPR